MTHTHNGAFFNDSTWLAGSGSGDLKFSRRGMTLPPLFTFFCGGDLTGVLCVEGAGVASGSGGLTVAGLPL